ncbi:MAG: pseudaminic acid synthase [Candidatus Vogelbacteria bacterium]|nr:pseudaminic acid synthase [Candidatus Vogelbacteria bacterium]
MRKKIKIGKREVGRGRPVFIVAEISGNHHQRYEEAVGLVKAAASAGADAVKLQTYTADTITLNSDKKWFRVGGGDNPKLWKGKTLYQLYQTAYTPWEWQPKLKKLAEKLGILFFSTPFDETAVDFLEKTKVPCYKIASYEATDFVLLRKVAQTGKPIIMSVGYASKGEVNFAVKTLKKYGAKEIVVLHCVTGYSGSPKLKDMNLGTIHDILKRFGVVSGFSDNNAGIEVPIMAVVAGASVIEKHLILDRKLGGPDAQFSIEPREFAEMVKKIRQFEQGEFKIKLSKTVLGKIQYGPNNKLEGYNKRWRRSLFISKDIKKGEVFTPKNVRSVRPAFGLETKYYDQIIGKRASKDIEFATPIDWSMIDSVNLKR